MECVKDATRRAETSRETKQMDAHWGGFVALIARGRTAANVKTQRAPPCETCNGTGRDWKGFCANCRGLGTVGPAWPCHCKCGCTLECHTVTERAESWCAPCRTGAHRIKGDAE